MLKTHLRAIHNSIMPGIQEKLPEEKIIFKLFILRTQVLGAVERKDEIQLKMVGSSYTYIQFIQVGLGPGCRPAVSQTADALSKLRF